MKRMEIGSWIIEVDVSKTSAFYYKQPLITHEWNSVYEENYVLACETFPQSVKSFFDSLGIDPQKKR